MASFDFTDNRVFDDRYSAFAPQSPQALPGGDWLHPVLIDTGIKVRENGDVDFAFYAPNAALVSVVFGVKANEDCFPCRIPFSVVNRVQ